ncbi:MAG: isoprenylcysteine carboxylmethyltransferase family protein [Geobacteraceae bacterium]|nr:isoprenylcysteine carboxylmethyltransferase family protein [Geobacteraceae bacterium]
MKLGRMVLNSLTVGGACLLGGGSLIIFAHFLYFGSLNLVNFGLGQGLALLFDAGLSLLFFLQHSGMVRKKFRHWLAGFIPEGHFAAVYAIASGVALFSLVFLWQEGELLFTAPPGILRWFFHAVFCLAVAGFLWSGMSLRYFDPFGIGPLLGRKKVNPEQISLTIMGPYRLVRHPLYLLSIMMIWSCPDLTSDRLLFNLFWTGWIIVGAFWEERDLIDQFGDAYREYRKRVPMLIPGINRWKRWPQAFH